MGGQLVDERDRIAVASKTGHDLLDSCAGVFSDIGKEYCIIISFKIELICLLEIHAFNVKTRRFYFSILKKTFWGRRRIKLQISLYIKI
jgi:hypothetical protein